jgi:hypothetical protein
VYTYPKEEVEKTQLQEVIKYMCPSKTGTILFVGVLSEGEMG